MGSDGSRRGAIMRLDWEGHTEFRAITRRGELKNIEAGRGNLRVTYIMENQVKGFKISSPTVQKACPPSIPKNSNR